ncbi:MAG: NAD(P)/FAD-dependent oxidoreductase [Desulfobacteraceae bacterium]
MRLAVIGVGISGLVAAYLLSPEHEVTVFEANHYLNGHSHTVDVPSGGLTYPVDTGFIVFNETTYPNFVKLLKRLGVDWQPANMSFSITNARTGLEYGFRNLNGLFAQRRNLVSLRFYRMLMDIWRFRRGLESLAPDKDYALEIGSYLKQKKYSSGFGEDFLLPLGSALWSSDPRQIQKFPARYLMEFFQRHRFLNLGRKIRWQTIRGGSRQYVERIVRPFQEGIRPNCPVAWVKRHQDFVEVKPRQGETERFDRVIIATHSDQALALLADPSDPEHEILRTFAYQPNSTVLHTDVGLMPTRRAAWTSWNYYLAATPPDRVTVTYHLNRLQSLAAPDEFLVTLNRDQDIMTDKIIGQMAYHHPIFTRQATLTQRRREEINGVNRTYFCGAYWGYGFHEDGVVSALKVCRRFGVSL